MEDAIGGYFSLELREGEHYHANALRLNSARNCFEYILRVRGYRKVFIPYYTCEVMLEPMTKLGIEYEFYTININFEPDHLPTLKNDEAFLYTNYFGLKQTSVSKLSAYYGNQLIIDNAQAFFAFPLEGIDTFYSARKFFGVPDGAYLYTDKLLEVELEQDISYPRCEHLLKRIDEGAGSGYSNFRNNDDSLVNNPIRLMSKLTDAILGSIDYKRIATQRRANFDYLHSHLGKLNKIELPICKDTDIPMIYPFYTQRTTLRRELIDNDIYVATYWANVLEWCENTSLEYGFVNLLIPIPVDQRYDKHNMEKIVKLISGCDGLNK